MANKDELPWNQVAKAVQNALNANKNVIPSDRYRDIQHYIDSGELGIAFEFLYLEVMERSKSGAILAMPPSLARSIGEKLELQHKNSCHFDPEFWQKFDRFVSR